MEEKTPVGSNAPIEESTEKKTSPAGSNSPSAAPAAGGSPSATPIAESAGAVDTASTDTGAESAPAGSSSRSWPAGMLSFCARSRARKCAGAAHPRTPAIPEDRRAIMPNHLSPSQPRLFPRHPFLKSVPQCCTPNLFTFPSSLFTKKAPAGRNAS